MPITLEDMREIPPSFVPPDGYEVVWAMEIRGSVLQPHRKYIAVEQDDVEDALSSPGMHAMRQIIVPKGERFTIVFE